VSHGSRYCNAMEATKHGQAGAVSHSHGDQPCDPSEAAAIRQFEEEYAMGVIEATDVYEGISYEVTLRATPWRDENGPPAQSSDRVMWSADCEIGEGVSLTASGDSPVHALGALHRVILSHTRPFDRGPLAALAQQEAATWALVETNLGAVKHRTPHPDDPNKCGGCRLIANLRALRSYLALPSQPAEADRVATYESMLRVGYSDAEARGTAWPESLTPSRAVSGPIEADEDEIADSDGRLAPKGLR
jgi:hypothetical protein